MDTSHLVTHAVGGDVLLGALLGAARLLHGLLKHRLVGLALASDAEVHAGADLVDLDAGRLLAAALRADGVAAQADGGLVVAVGGLVGGDGDDPLQALDVDLVRLLAAEEVDEEGARVGVLVGDGAVPGGAGEVEHGLEADGHLLALELGERAEGLRVEVELEHVEHLVAEGADEGDGVGPLLGGVAEDDNGGVVLLGEELDRVGVVEGVDVVLLHEALREGLAELVELVEGILGDLRARRSAEEEGCLGILSVWRR